MTLNFEALEYRVEGSAAWIRLNRPEALNAFTTQAYVELRQAIRLADLDPEVGVAVIIGTGRSFATGGDLLELLGYLQGDTPLDVMRFVDSSPFSALRDAKVTVIAAVNGICVAGGLIVTAMSDIVVAAESATFGLPEVRWGLAEAISVSALYPHVGLHRLKYLAFTGKAISARQAENYGIVNEVVPDVDLIQRTNELIAELGRTDAAARATYKGYLNKIAPDIDYTTTIEPGMDIGKLIEFSERGQAKAGRDRG